MNRSRPFQSSLPQKEGYLKTINKKWRTATSREYTSDRTFVRTFFTSPTAVEGKDDTAAMLESAAGLVAVDGPYDDIRDIEGYRQRMNENRAKGMTGIWALTPGQAEAANAAPLPPEKGSYLFDIGSEEVELEQHDDGAWVYDGDDVSIEELGEDSDRLRAGAEEYDLDTEGLRDELSDRAAYVPSMDDIVNSMEEFETAKAEGKGAISMERSATVRIDGIDVDVSSDRVWDEATYQAAMTPIDLFQGVYASRPDQRDALVEKYGEDLVDRANQVG
jgi:bifunctional (S)-malyl-CoA lyase/thioesterase